MSNQKFKKLEKQFYCKICGAHDLASCHVNEIKNVPRNLHTLKCYCCGISNIWRFGGRYLYQVNKEFFCSPCFSWATWDAIRSIEKIRNLPDEYFVTRSFW